MKNVLLLLTALLLILSSSVFSQEALLDTTFLDEVVVVATKTPHSIYAVPASISVIGKNKIDHSAVMFADEALRSVPGLYIKRSKIADQTSSVTLRGFSGDARTLVLLDGMPLNDGYNQGVNWGGIPTDAIEKVEVVKGSFSSLYGGNAMGGVINIITNIPTEEAITLKSSYGTYNTFNTSVSYSNRFLKNKKLAFYFDMGQKSSDGYVSNFYLAKPNAGTGANTVTGWEKSTNNKGVEYYLLGDMGKNYMKQTQIVGKIAYYFNSNSVLDFNYNSSLLDYGYSNPQSYLKTQANLPFNNGTITINDGTAKTISVKPYSFLVGPGDGFVDTYRLHYKAKFNGIFLTAYAGLTNDKTEYISCATGATEDGGPGSINKTQPKQTYIANLQVDIPIKNHLLTVGADYRIYNAKGEEWNLTDWADDNSKTTLKSSMQGNQKIIAPFVQAELKIASNLKSFLGIRYDHWNNTDGKSNNGKKDTIYANTSASEFSPKAGFVYTPKMKGDLWRIKSVRTSIGNSFRTPTLYNLYKTWDYGTTSYLANPSLKPESSTSWEFGITQVAFKESTFISFDYYESYIKDLMYNAEISTGVKKQMNAGKGEVKGFEIEVRQKVGSFLDLNFNINKQQTEITENSTDIASVGKSFTNVPDLIYNIGANYHKGPLNVMLAYNYTSKVYSTSDNSDTTQGVYGGYDKQTLFDGKASYQINKNVNFSLAVNNIFDKEYYLYYKAPGRSFTVGVTAKF